MACKSGKVKNENGRCVKVKEECKEGKEKHNGRCVKKCSSTQHRNEKGKCVSNKNRTIKNKTRKLTKVKISSSQLQNKKNELNKLYKKPLPTKAGLFRGQLITRKRNLKHKTSSKKKTSTDSAYGHFKW